MLPYVCVRVRTCACVHECVRAHAHMCVCVYGIHLVNLGTDMYIYAGISGCNNTRRIWSSNCSRSDSWQALQSPHIVGLFCPYRRSLLTLFWSTQAIEEKERLLQNMWAEKQMLLRAMSRLNETHSSVDEAQLEVAPCLCVRTHVQAFPVCRSSECLRR